MLSAELTEAKAELAALKADAERKRGLLLWSLYHHQGGNSEVGQPIRKELGIGQFDDLTEEQIKKAKDAATPEAKP